MKKLIIGIILLSATLFAQSLDKTNNINERKSDLKKLNSGSVNQAPKKILIGKDNNYVDANSDKKQKLNKLSDKPKSKSDFQQLLQEFLDKQANPLIDADEEAFLLDGQIWQRQYGEREYFLVPSISDISAYHDRIKRLDDKENGIIKSKSRKVDVEVTEISKSLLSEMGIVVPSYIKEHIFVMLPEIDIEILKQNNINLNVLEDYGQQNYYESNRDNVNRDQIWFEGWEGSLSPYTFDGDQGWGDVSCRSYSGSRSLWCADEVESPCTEYNNNMDTYVWPTNGVNVSGYEDLQFKFKIWYDTEINDDICYRYYWNGSAWQVSSVSYSGDSGGWISRTVDLNNFTTYYWKFKFESDWLLHSWEGVYLDNLEITGNPPQLPADLDVLGICPEFPYTGGECEVRVDNDGGATLNWGSSVSPGDNDWLDRSPNSGNIPSGNYQWVTITVAPNSNSYRDGYINFYNYDEPGDNEDVAIQQVGPECELSEDNDIIDPVPAGGGTYSITLNNTGETDIAWSLNINCDWISSMDVAGSINSEESLTINVNISENTVPGSRNCNLVIETDCGNYTISVNQEGPDDSYTCGNLRIRGDSITGSGSNYTISGNVEIGHINNGNNTIIFPDGVFSVNTSGNGSITPNSGYSEFHSVYDQSIAFESISGLSFNTSSGSATFLGEFQISNDISIPFNSETLYFQTETIEISAQNFIDILDVIPSNFPNFTAAIDLSSTTFTFGLEIGECIDFWDILAINTQNEISWSFDINSVAIGINVDLDFLEIGKVGGDCIDLDGFVFSPLPAGPQIHVEWDVDGRRLTFTDTTSISIPLSVVRDHLSDEQIAKLFEEGRIIVTRDERTYVTLGITVYSGSFINFETGSFNLNCGIDVDVAGSSVMLDPVLISYDGACEFVGSLGIGGNLFSNWVEANAGMGFSFNDCDRNFCLNGSFGLDLWLSYLELDAEMCFHYVDDPWINGTLQAYLEILGWQISSGAEFQLSSDYLIINGYLFDLPGQTTTRIDSFVCQWNIDKGNQMITGNILESLDITNLGFPDFTEGQFVFDPINFSLSENDSTLFFENNYKAVSMNWKLSNSEELVVSNLDNNKISISVPSYIDVLRLIYLEDSSFVEVNDSSLSWTMLGFSGDQGDDGDNKYIHLYFDNTPASAFLVQIENSDQNEMLDFVSFQSGLTGRGVSNLADYSNSNIEMNVIYEVLLDGSVNNISGGSESISPEWSLNLLSESGDFVFQSIFAEWNESFDTLGVSLSTSLPSESWLVYGETDTSSTDTLWDLVLSDSHEFYLTDVFSDWEYQFYAIDEDSNLIISSWRTVPPRGIPVVDFSANTYYGCAPFEIQFINETDQGAGELLSYMWDFGDGENSGEIEPVHIYEEAGVYTVSLTVTTTFGEDIKICTDCIEIEELVAGFIANPTQGEFPLTVLFADTSIINGENTVWSWDFDGDGVEDDSTVGPHFWTYDSIGVYYPELIITTSCGVDTSGIDSIIVNILGIHDSEHIIPNKYYLYQNNPNPFNPITTVRYDLPENSFVNITIYDMLGRKIRTLINQTQEAGYKSVIWDSTNANGKPVSAGVYLYQIRSGEFVQTKKMVLLK